MKFVSILLGAILLACTVESAVAENYSGRYSEDEPLSAAQAFPISMMSGRNGELLVMWQMPPGYYLYRDKIQFASKGDLVIKRVNVPNGMVKNDPLMGSVRIYRDMVTVVVVPKNKSRNGELMVKFQGCLEDKLCYPPMTRVFKLQG